jgi:excisionase family DNA binding protein
VGAVPGGATDGEIRCSVPRAARLLGISERAVRKRIAAGTLRAEPFGRSYRIWLPEDAPPPGPEPGPEPIEATFRPTGASVAVSPAAYAQLEAIRDRWLAPLVETIAEQAQQIGRLDAERDVAEQMVHEQRRRAERAEREREQLRRQAEALEAERDRLLAEAVHSASPAAPAGTSGAIGAGEGWEDPEPLWRRLWRSIKGE